MSEKYWSNEKKLYSDGSFEVLWGNWKDDPHKTLGIHWIDSDESRACPKLHGGEVGWLVVPPILTLTILNQLLSTIDASPECGSPVAILEAIGEFSSQKIPSASK